MDIAQSLDSRLLPGSTTVPDRPYIKLHSMIWRIRHILQYIFGGIFFIVGSVYYIPGNSNYEVGGWLYLVGSISFFLADIQEWWKNNKVGCAFDAKYRDDYESVMAPHLDPPETFSGRFQRAEQGIYFALAAFGSFLFVVGSAMFIPAVGALEEGDIIFLVGCVIVMVAQGLKVYLHGRTNESDPSDRSFHMVNLYSHGSSRLGKEITTFFGGLGYLVGAVFFLSIVGYEIYAATFFILGSVSYIFSGMFLYHRYFLTDEFPQMK